MPRKNPLGTLKDVAVGSMKAPITAAESAVKLAKGTVAAGASSGAIVARTATGKAAGAVSALVGGGTTRPATAAPQKTPAEPRVPPAESASQPEPVNVVEELGLDPAPVDKPKRAKKSPAEKPVTGIDAAADAADVHVTPADVAAAIEHKTPPEG